MDQLLSNCHCIPVKRIGARDQISRDYETLVNKPNDLKVHFLMKSTLFCHKDETQAVRQATMLLVKNLKNIQNRPMPPAYSKMGHFLLLYILLSRLQQFKYQYK